MGVMRWIRISDCESKRCVVSCRGIAFYPFLFHVDVAGARSPVHFADHPPTPRPSRQPDSLPWEPTRPQDKAYFGERIGAPLLPLRPRCNFIHPRQLSPFRERLGLPFSNDEILSGFEDIVSSGTDQFYCIGQDGPSRGLGTSYG